MVGGDGDVSARGYCYDAKGTHCDEIRVRVRISVRVRVRVRVRVSGVR